MSKGKNNYPLPIRLDLETRNRIAVAANRLKTGRSAIVRLALANMLPQIEAGYIKLNEVVEHA